MTRVEPATHSVHQGRSLSSSFSRERLALPAAGAPPSRAQARKSSYSKHLKQPKKRQLKLRFEERAAFKKCKFQLPGIFQLIGLFQLPPPRLVSRGKLNYLDKLRFIVTLWLWPMVVFYEPTKARKPEFSAENVFNMGLYKK